MPASLLVSRVIATLLTLIRSPMDSLQAVPGNWWNVIAKTDSRVPPELLPGYVGDGEEISKPHLILRGVWRGADRAYKRVGSTLLTAALIPMFIVALAYRWTIKGTAILWMPLLWIVQGAFLVPVNQQMVEVREVLFYRLALLYSCAVLLVFALKIWGFLSVLDHCAKLLNVAVCEYVIVPVDVPPWQLAAVINAVLGVALFLASDLLLVRLRHGIHFSDYIWSPFIKWLRFCRGVLTIYTVACAIYIVAVMSERWVLPPLGTRFFPW